MFTETVGTGNVPAFLSKLWRLVDSSHNDLISWSPNGKSFIIRDQAKFAKELLPLYFKHNNMASFIRQLNMYGFRKITHIENSGLKIETDEIEFYHSCFLKGQENLLEFIKRKNSLSVAHAKSNGALEEKTNKEEVSILLTDVKDMKNRQDSFDSLLVRMQNENEALWKEIAVLRHKHQRQQQIVVRLMHFLLQLVQSGSISVKRKAPLMIGNKNGGSDKLLSDLNVQSNFFNLDTGPIIQEITHGLLEEDELNENLNVNSPIINTALSESSETAPQFDEPIDSPIFVNTPTSSNLNQQQQNQEQLTIQALENDLKENNVFDPLQESIRAINEDDKDAGNLLDDQILDLEAVGGVPVESPSIIVQNNDNYIQQNQTEVPIASSALANTNLTDEQQLSNVAPTGLKLVMPSVNISENVFSTNSSLVPSTSNALNTPNVTMEHFDNHIEGIDSELNSLQEQLLLGNFNIDSNVLMGLFTPENQQKANEALQYASKDLPAIGNTVSSINLNSPLSTPRPIVHTDQVLNSNYELCDIVNNPIGDNIFSDNNQNDLLNSGIVGDSMMDKNLGNLGNAALDSIDNQQIFTADDLLTSDTDIDSLFNQVADDSDLFNKEPKKRRIS